MSFVSVIRDYVEVLNNLNDSFSSGAVPLSDVVKETGLFFLKTFQSLFFYLISFQWVRDFTLLPITIPQLSTSLIQEKFVLENSTSSFLNFLEIQNFSQNSFFVGFINSLFLTLPISVIHILTIRRLYIKGTPSAVYSIGGYLTGQLFFITCVILGIRIIIIPWFSLEPLNYILGIILLFKVIASMTKENLQEVNSWDAPQYKEFFITSFLIAWCEQTSIFQYLGNLNFGPTTSLLEITQFSGLPQHILYMLGLTFGSVLFTLFWGILCFQVKNYILQYSPFLLTKFARSINTGCIIICIGLSLSSIPFYGLDYLITKPLGFISQDRVFRNTILSQYTIKDFVNQLGLSVENKGFGFDTTPFDRGRYGILPPDLSFEDLNYRGETEWQGRHEKKSGIAHKRGTKLQEKLVKTYKSSTVENTDNIFPIRSKWDISVPPSNQIVRNERFQNWYFNDSDLGDENTKSLNKIFKLTQESTYPTQLLQFTSTDPNNLDLKLKQEYYSNPVYKRLLNTEIDLFLLRQPKEFRLSSDEELDLYTKRRMLQSYYDSLRDYSKIPYSKDFENFFDGTKSFSNKVYNQQFKGTLRSVSRLFSLTVDPEANLDSNQIVLKYDQPLYIKSPINKFSAFHEELGNNSTQTSQLNRFDSNVSSFPEDQDRTTNPTAEVVSFDSYFSGPLYAGWNEKQRKFVLTNKTLPRSFAGYKFKLTPDLQKNFIGQSPTTKKSTIKFSSWPLSEEKISTQKINKDTSIPFNVLYSLNTEIQESEVLPKLTDLTIPANVDSKNRFIAQNKDKNLTIYTLFDYLAPKRGGFIWPGNAQLNLKLKNLESQSEP